MSNDMLTIREVASLLGVSVRTVRRQLEEGSFPRSHISQGKTAYWQRQTVRTWERDRLRIDPMKGHSRHYTDTDAVDREEEIDFARKPIDTQALERGRLEMQSLIAENPDEFARQYPKLKGWMKDKGIL